MDTSRWSNIGSMLQFYRKVGFEQASVAGFDAVGYGGVDGPCRSLPCADFDICNGIEVVALIDENLDIIRLIDKNDPDTSQPYAEFSANYRGTRSRRWGFVFPEGEWKLMPNPDVRIPKNGDEI